MPQKKLLRDEAALLKAVPSNFLQLADRPGGNLEICKNKKDSLRIRKESLKKL
jgi:hypothetical protein